MAGRPRPGDRGFTLLEVLLALALSAVVVYLIAGALDFHLRQLTVRRTSIEQAQLARAILRRIADDLRAAVVDRPADFSSAGQFAQASATGSLSTDGSSSASSGAATGGTTGGGIDSGAASSTTDMSAGVMSAMPGIYGTEVELQIDISRVPRYEEYAMVDPINNPEGMRLLSDVKTVSYFVLDQFGNASGGLGMGSGFNQALDPTLGDYSMLGLPPGQPLRGLGRRIVDRASARYAMSTAEYSFLDQQFELLAPEVLFVQFRYFDGFQWLPAWDTQQYGGVPVAVEIILALRSGDDEADAQQPTSGGMSYAQLTSTVDPSQVYRLVVHLPAANLLDLAAATGTSSSSTTTQQGMTP